MTKGSDVLEDFSLLKNLSIAQLSELIDDLSATSEKVSQELPVMLDSFAEVAADKSGRTSQAQRMLRSYVSNFCKSIEESYAYRFLRAGMNYKLSIHPTMEQFHLSRTREAFLSRAREALGGEKMNILKTDWSSLRPFGYPFCLPWRPSDSPSYFDDAQARSMWIVASHRQESFLFKPIALSYEALEAFFGHLRLFSERYNLNSVTVDFFEDSAIRGTLGDMFANEPARMALQVFIAKSVSSLICEATGLSPEDQCIGDQLYSEDSYGMCESDLATIDEEYPENALKKYCRLSYEKIKALSPDDVDAPEWGILKRKAEEFFCALVMLSISKEEQISLMMGDEREILQKTIFEFLKKNNLNPLSIPTIAELGKFKGGFALVKSISASGGLRRIRELYIPWATQRIKQDEGDDKYSQTAFPLSTHQIGRELLVED